MAATRVQTTAGNSGGYNQSIGLTWSSNTTTGNTIIVAIASGDSSGGGDIASVTDSQSNSYTRIDAGENVGGARLELWYAYNITGGTTPTVTATVTSGFHDLVMVMREYSGLTTSDPLDQYTGNGEAGYDINHATGNTGTTTQANELVVGAYGGDNSASTYTAGSGFGNVNHSGGSDLYKSCVIEDKDVTSVGVQSATITSSEYMKGYMICATFKEQTAAPAIEEPKIFMTTNTGFMAPL